MSTALTIPKAADMSLCGACGGRLTCTGCAVRDAIDEARIAVVEVVRGSGGRNAMARLSAAKIILAKDFLAYLSDEELLAEVKRRKGARR